MRARLEHLRGKASIARRRHAFAALGGAALLALSLVFITGGYELGFGSPRRLGTGAFPIITGLLLAVLSLAVIVADLRDTSALEQPDWISFAAIGSALAVFALSVGPLGLIPAAFLSTVTASLPDRALHLLGKVALGALVALACWALFIGLIGLPFAPFGGL